MSRLFPIILTGLCVLTGFGEAIRQAWVCDDAFISFRYAHNLLSGHGLVFNPGERVEGFTNFLWTMLLTPFMAAGIGPIFISKLLGLIACAGLFLVVLIPGREYLKISAPGEGRTSTGDRSYLWPWSLGAIALHDHLQIFATSGLETSLFTLLITLGVLLLLRPEHESSRAAFFVLTLAALTRPDGLLVYGLGALWWFGSFLEAKEKKEAVREGKGGESRFAGFVKDVLKTHIVFILVYIPLWLGRLYYYGEVFPNTYYAKSAYSSYWSQGFLYNYLYFYSYWILAAAVPVSILALIFLPASRKALVFPLILILFWTLYIAKVGGDFMYARFLLPITPLMYLTLEKAIRELIARYQPRFDGRFSPGLSATIILMFVLGTVWRPDPYGNSRIPLRDGIGEENKIYTPGRVEHMRKLALGLYPTLQEAGPVFAFGGAQAMLAYYWSGLVAIEAETGLTDSYIAHRKISRRGRVGHEKQAPLEYLRKRRVSFIIRPTPPERRRGFNELYIHGFPAPAEILVYRPEVMNVLKKNPAFTFADFPEYLDAYLKNPPPALRVKSDLEFFRSYYFDHVQDLKRLRRLEQLAGR